MNDGWIADADLKTYRDKVEPVITRTVGKRKKGETPQERFWRAQALIEQMDRLNPYPRPRGFVKKFRTHEDYEKWKAEQKNPRLW